MTPDEVLARLVAGDRISTDDGESLLLALGWGPVMEAPNATFYKPPEPENWRPFRLRHDGPDLFTFWEQAQLTDAIRAWAAWRAAP